MRRRSFICAVFQRIAALRRLEEPASCYVDAESASGIKDGQTIRPMKPQTRANRQIAVDGVPRKPRRQADCDRFDAVLKTKSAYVEVIVPDLTTGGIGWHQASEPK
jgi:hypothetical protein